MPEWCDANWTVTGGTRTSPNGTSSVTYTANASGTVQLSVTVVSFGGSATGNKSVPISGAGSTTVQSWNNSGTPQWQGGNTTGNYSEGQSIPFRVILNQQCSSASWAITIEYEFQKTSSGKPHFIDYLTSFDASECTANGIECAGFAVCVPGSSVSGIFKVYNGNITLVDPEVTIPGSTTLKQVTIHGTVAGGGGKRMSWSCLAAIGASFDWGTTGKPRTIREIRVI
jgi:hypothetical protein